MKRYIATILLVLMVAGVFQAVGAGTAEDPVVSLSYIEQTYIPQMKEKADKEIDKKLEGVYNNAFLSIAQRMGEFNAELAASDLSLKAGEREVGFKKGDIISGTAGSTLELVTGKAVITGGSVQGAGSGAAATAGKTYVLSAEDGSGFKITSDTATVYISGYYILDYSSETDYTAMADALFTLGLFKGRSQGYALESTANRAEGLTMFLRLLGEEDEALAYTGTHPFTDVPEWADRSVAYAYHMGYTKGTSETRFGSDSALTSAHYLTFLLRALGYVENTDFTWANVANDAVTLKLINAEERTLAASGFDRGTVVYLSYWSLYSGGADGRSILTRLIDSRDVSEDDAIAAIAACKAVRLN